MTNTGKITLDEAKLYLRDTTTEDEALKKMIDLAEATIEGLTGILTSNFQRKQAALAMLAIIYESDVRIDTVYGVTSSIYRMTPTQTARRFYCLLLDHFHHGHDRAFVDRLYRQVCEEINKPKTGDND